MAEARYKFKPVKALAAVRWMLQQESPLDMHTLLKACYFADKNHLNEHLKPIFGASYRAMRYGPVPLQIYEMLKAEPMWLHEVERDEMPWRLDGYRVHCVPGDNVDLSSLSETDVEHLTRGLEQSRSMNFNERTAATHGADWQKANLGMMRYEDMLDDGPDRDDRVQFIQDTALFTKL